MELQFHRWYPRVLSPSACRRLMGLQGQPETATVGSGRREDLGLRRSEVTWLSAEEPEVCDLTRLMRSYAAEQGVVLSEELPEVQLTRYTAANKGIYGPHMDCGEGRAAMREVSCSVLLNDPAEFGGGELRFPHLGRTPPALRRGEACVFRSWLVHGVGPVWRGERWSLVLWLRGQPLPINPRVPDRP